MVFTFKNLFSTQWSVSVRFLSSPSACRTSGVSKNRDWSVSFFEDINRIFSFLWFLVVPLCLWYIFWQILWRNFLMILIDKFFDEIFLTNFSTKFDDIFEDFFEDFFVKFFWRFFDELFWRFFLWKLTSFLTNFWIF